MPFLYPLRSSGEGWFETHSHHQREVLEKDISRKDVPSVVDFEASHALEGVFDPSGSEKVGLFDDIETVVHQNALEFHFSCLPLHFYLFEEKGIIDVFICELLFQDNDTNKGTCSKYFGKRF